VQNGRLSPVSYDRDPLTGQDYAPYRWYSSTMNRWLSRDPLGMVDGPNVYAYVRGNPSTYYDPDGISNQPSFSAGAASSL
jgi:RHS repeat-associated protein